MIDTELLGAAAGNLCGRPVVVRFQEPPTRNSLGEAYLEGHDQAVIDLAPVLRCYPDKLLDVFLHEAAHVKLHLPRRAAAPIPSPGPGTFQIVNHAAYQASPIEQQAGDLAAKWAALAAADLQASPYYRPGNEPLNTELRLICLRYTGRLGGVTT